MSYKSRAESEVRDVLNNELYDAIKAIKAGNYEKALRELSYAEDKLKNAADNIRRIDEAR